MKQRAVSPVLAARKTALGCSVALLLGACGGRPDATPAQTEAFAQALAAPARSVGATLAAAPGTTAAPLAEDMLDVKQRLALLQREVAELRRELAGRLAAVRPAEVVADPRRDADARVQAEQVEQQRIAAAEAAFGVEKEDARWSRGASADVRGAWATAADAVRAQLRSVECRAQTCRVEIGADAGAQLGLDLPRVLNRLGAVLPNVTAGQIDQGDGRLATVLYLSR